MDHRAALEEDVLSPVFEQAVAHTGFAPDLFKARADRDGAALVLLTTHSLGKRGDPVFDRLHNLAEARAIPLISQYAWIERQGGDARDALEPGRPPVGGGSPARTSGTESGGLSRDFIVCSPAKRESLDLIHQR